MARLSKKLRSIDLGNGQGIGFFCPGCQRMHSVKISGKGAWQYNGDTEKPTLSPSVLVTGIVELTEEQHTQVLKGVKIEPIPLICHSFITNGLINFLTDCTHKFAGQIVEIPDLPY